MRSEDVIRELAGTISGVRILETAADIARFHRVPGSPGYAEAADVVCRRLAEAGVAATVHDYPADGRTKTYEWVSPPAWSVQAGTLIQTAPAQRKLIDFAEVAQGVVVHSPGGAFEGELIHLGVPTGDADYDAADLAGKVATSSCERRRAGQSASWFTPTRRGPRSRTTWFNTRASSPRRTRSRILFPRSPSHVGRPIGW
jgi:hypothetical protein